MPDAERNESPAALPALAGGEADRWLEVFLNGFAARDLAESLTSFDETAPASLIHAAMSARRLEVVGVRQGGQMTGWLSREDVEGATLAPQPRAFDPQAMLPDSASFHTVVAGLATFDNLFVQCFGQIAGVIRRSDLQKPPMRMWLFGLVTISELRVTRMIDELCPHESWRQYLSEGRLQKASDLQSERRRKGQSPSLLDCLQFADKGQIVARDERLREQTRFASKRQVEEFVKSLQTLRDNLAHAQDITGDWPAIHDLATNLHRIVLGPPATP